MHPVEPTTVDETLGVTVDEAIDEALDEALAGTESLDSIPLAEHVARFDAVHTALNDALSRIDTD